MQPIDEALLAAFALDKGAVHIGNWCPGLVAKFDDGLGLLLCDLKISVWVLVTCLKAKPPRAPSVPIRDRARRWRDQKDACMPIAHRFCCAHDSSQVAPWLMVLR